MARVAVRTAALTAMRVICQPGMPPTTTVWVVVTGGAGGLCKLPGGGLSPAQTRARRWRMAS